MLEPGIYTVYARPGIAYAHYFGMRWYTLLWTCISATCYHYTYAAFNYPQGYMCYVRSVSTVIPTVLALNLSWIDSYDMCTTQERWVRTFTYGGSTYNHVVPPVSTKCWYTYVTYNYSTRYSLVNCCSRCIFSLLLVRILHAGYLLRVGTQFGVFYSKNR